ncbi:MAG: RdgB/HAM1 family non-canonical purine NTP pyrophosphatase [Nocardioidaceae bacterium]|nr:RdgB/HAM1 family non-canonical purine NTP pyrophosphatase [Nocardioidaceae bacterium]MCL2613463.1 RdgB/HAM1 family non-canonical purine NTP pyrophosphatase [Nocardioidaceae bacterium]
MTRVLVASGNAKKVLEMERILSAHLPGIEVVGLADVPAYDEPVEDQPTFAGNALLKARAGLAATGLATIADDSGLCVDALNGMPGVLSARWSGQPTLRDGSPLASSGTGRAELRSETDARNNRLLLDQLHDVPDERRGAHFTCSIAFVRPDGEELVVEGRMDGRVLREQRGSGGFGYDVLFEADDHPGATTAELSREDKDAISHRGKALREIAPQVVALLG